jgi:ssDNA-binding Zn-finger/Zn-ribbon topoisomerase 1
MRTKCPRCGSETVDLGISTKEFRNRKMQVDYRLCPKCKLVFCEGT